MAAYLNRVELLGQLTGEPAIVQQADGSQCIGFGLSVTTQVPNLRGETVGETCLLDVRCFGRTADSVRASVHDGMMVFIDGRLQMERWVDSTTGLRRSRLYVVADTLVVAEFGAVPASPDADGSAF